MEDNTRSQAAAEISMEPFKNYATSVLLTTFDGAQFSSACQNVSSSELDGNVSSFHMIIYSMAILHDWLIHQSIQPLLFSSDLNCNVYINNNTKKANGTLGVLRQNLSTLGPYDLNCQNTLQHVQSGFPTRKQTSVNQRQSRAARFVLRNFNRSSSWGGNHSKAKQSQ